MLNRKSVAVFFRLQNDGKSSTFTSFHLLWIIVDLSQHSATNLTSGLRAKLSCNDAKQEAQLTGILHNNCRTVKQSHILASLKQCVQGRS